METRTAKTYRELKVALDDLDDEALDKGIVVSAGCDENGEAEFFSVDAFTFACCPDVEAAAMDLFDELQPILLFNDGSLLDTQ